jgi:hypothetical protein
MRGSRLLVVLGATAAVGGGTAGTAVAEPPPPAPAPFVCPTLNLPPAAIATGHFGELGDTGQYTIAPPVAGDPETFDGNVPLHATNGDGDGTPGVDQAGPGDPGYSAIWSGN